MNNLFLDILRIAWRSVIYHRARSITIITILTIFIVTIILGTSIVQSVAKVQEESIVHSISGHLQIIHAESDDDYQMFGKKDGTFSRMVPIEKIEKIESLLKKHHNVKSLIPMSVNEAITYKYSLLERAIIDLRTAVNSRSTPKIEQSKKSIINTIERYLVAINQLEKRNELFSETDDQAKKLRILKKSISNEFWGNFEEKTEKVLEFLENEVGPLIEEEKIVYFPYIATDLNVYKSSFNKFSMVEGRSCKSQCDDIVYLNKMFYEENYKNEIARRLDKIYRSKKEGESIENSLRNKNDIEENIKQTHSLISQWDEHALNKIAKALTSKYDYNKESPIEIIKQFFNMNDENFMPRYEAFYEVIFPHIEMYEKKVGDDIIVYKTSSETGYREGVKLKIQGIFTYSGLEKSKMSNIYNIIPLRSYEKLSGRASRAELVKREMEVEQFGAEDLDKDEVEKIFNEISTEENSGEVQKSRINKVINKNGLTKENIAVESYAVILKDSQKSKITQEELKEEFKKNKIPLKIKAWNETCFFIENTIKSIKYALSFLIVVVIIISMGTISGVMILYISNRRKEIGVLRAVGFAKNDIIRIVISEIGVMCFVSIIVGSMLGTILLLILKSIGIPSINPFMYFIVGGPNLYPVYNFNDIGIAGAAALLSVLLGILYPLSVALKISPREAFQQNL